MIEPPARSTGSRLAARLPAAAWGAALRCSLALGCVAAAMRLARRTGARWDLAEMHRVRGELLWQSGEQSASLRAFERALRAARHNGARLFEQRAQRALSERPRERTALPCTNTVRRNANGDAGARARTREKCTDRRRSDQSDGNY